MKKDFNKAIKSTKEEIVLHAIYGHRGEYCSRCRATRGLCFYNKTQEKCSIHHLLHVEWGE